MAATLFVRYLLIANPIALIHFTGKMAICIVLFIWMYSSVVTLLPSFGWAANGVAGSRYFFNAFVSYDIKNNRTYFVY